MRVLYAVQIFIALKMDGSVGPKRWIAPTSELESDDDNY